MTRATSEPSRQTDFRKKWERKQRRLRGDAIFKTGMALVFVALLMVLYMFKILGNRRESPVFHFLTEEPLAHTVETTALILRDETVYRAPIDGIYRGLIPQGSKVGRGARLGEILPTDKIDELRQLEKAEQDVNDRRFELMGRDSSSDAERIVSASDLSIRRSMTELYDAILNQDLTALHEIDASLRLTLDQRREDLTNFDFKDEELTRLMEYRDRLENSLSGQKRTVTAEVSGIYVRQIDGLESELPVEKVNSLTVGELQTYLSRSLVKAPAVTETVEADKAFYKLCRSIDHYFVALLPRGTLSPENVEEDGNRRDDYAPRRMSLQIPSKNMSIQDLHLIRAEETRDGTLVALRTNKGLEELVGMRRLPITLAFEESVGLRVPRSALIGYQPGNLEAKVKAVSGGYIQTLPVLIKEISAQYALIESPEGSETPLQVSSLILLNPSSMEEGEAISDVR